MAAVTTLAISSIAPGTATLTINGTAYDLTGHQVIQLHKLTRRLTVNSQGGVPSQSAATVTKPTGV